MLLLFFLLIYFSGQSDSSSIGGGGVFILYNDDLIKPVFTVAAADTTPADRENMRAGGPPISYYYYYYYYYYYTNRSRRTRCVTCRCRWPPVVPAKICQNVVLQRADRFYERFFFFGILSAPPDCRSCVDNDTRNISESIFNPICDAHTYAVRANKRIQ